MEELDKLLNNINKKISDIELLRDNYIKKRIIINSDNLDIKKEYEYLRKLDKYSSLLKKIVNLLSVLSTLYISGTILYQSLNNIMLVFLTSPIVYLISDEVFNYVVNNILYNLKNCTTNSIPVKKEMLEKTMNDNEIKLAELDIEIENKNYTLNYLKSLEKEINNYKDDQEVEVEFYDIEQTDKIVKFNKSLKLIKNINKKGDE